MSKPNDTPLSVTAEALQTVSALALHSPDVEVCGFLLGTNDVANHVVAVRNDAPDPRHTFVMNTDGILETYKEADANGQDVLAVWHSHPASEAIPSEHDKAVPDIDPVQLIVSLKDGQPRCRAWRLSTPYVGERQATEVMVHVSDDGQPFVMKPSVVPWALQKGNQVRIRYSRTEHGISSRVVTATVKGWSTANDVLVDHHAVLLETKRKTDPKMIDLSRIRGVEVLHEAAAAQRMRHKMTMLGRRAAHLMQNQRYDDLADIIAVLSAAFPSNIASTVEAPQS